MIIKRDKLIEKLKNNISFFDSPYISFHGESFIDKNKDMSWLWEDVRYYPSDSYKSKTISKIIPYTYLEGDVALVGNKTYVSEAIWKRKRLNRRVCLQITDFSVYGNRHRYGKLNIEGLTWIDDNDCTIISSELLNINPLIRSWWEVELQRIITNENDIVCDDSYKKYNATQRFESWIDLYCVAAYVTLIRCEGPVELFEGDTYIIPEEKDYLFKTLDNDTIEVTGCLEVCIRER